MLAGVLFPVSAVAYWIHGTVLDSARFTAAVTPLAADQQVREAVSGALTARITDAVQSGELVSSLPPALQGLGTGLAAALAQQIGPAVTTFVSSDAFATAWDQTNSRAQLSLVNSLNGEHTGALTARGSQIVLDPGVVLQQLQAQLATGPLSLLARVPLPADLSRPIVLVDSPQLTAFTTLYPHVAPVAPWLGFAVIALFVLAVVVATRRLLTLTLTGVALLLGAATLVLFDRYGQQQLTTNLEGSSLPGLAGVAEPYWQALASGLHTWTTMAAAVGAVLVVSGLGAALLRRR